jgi:hypothetical protein
MNEKQALGVAKVLGLLNKPKPKVILKDGRLDKIEKDILAIIWGHFNSTGGEIKITELQDEILNYFSNMRESAK